MTVTDLYGNTIAEVDSSMLVGTEFSDDSNINVFEFANVLLAGLLPTFVWIASTLTDLTGDVVLATDTTGSSLTESDSAGISLTADDILGATVSEEDVTEVVMSITNFFAYANEILDIEGTSLTVSEWSGNLVSSTNVSIENSTEYDFASCDYDCSNITYNGMGFQGTVVDISGS